MVNRALALCLIQVPTPYAVQSVVYHSAAQPFLQSWPRGRMRRSESPHSSLQHSCLSREMGWQEGDVHSPTGIIISSSGQLFLSIPLVFLSLFFCFFLFWRFCDLFFMASLPLLSLWFCSSIGQAEDMLGDWVPDGWGCYLVESLLRNVSVLPLFCLSPYLRLYAWKTPSQVT